MQNLKDQIPHVNDPLSPEKNKSWHNLSDNQKAKLMLNHSRLSEEENFLKIFKSWEQPDLENNK